MSNPTLQRLQQDFMIGGLDRSPGETLGDVLVGEDDLSDEFPMLGVGEQTMSSKNTPTPTNHSRTSSSSSVADDFVSIEDLIAEELEKTPLGRARKKEAAVVKGQEDVHEKIPEKFQDKFHELSHSNFRVPMDGTASAPAGEEAQEEFETISRASTLARSIAPEIEKLAAMFRSSPDQRSGVMEHLRIHKEALRNEQDILQSLISVSIREGRFERVSKVDGVKRKIDEVFLQIRSLENTIAPQGVNLNRTELYADGSSAESLYEEAEKVPHGVKKVDVSKQKTVARWQVSGTKIKITVVILLIALMPLGYYYSSQWGVVKAVKIDHTIYASALPLTKAQASNGTFTGVLDSSWMTMKKEDKETAIKILASLIRNQGFKNIFLVTERGIAGTYNLTNDRFMVY